MRIRMVSPWPTRNNGISTYADHYRREFERQGETVEMERLFFWGRKTDAWKWLSVLGRCRPGEAVVVQHTPTCSGPFLPWFLGRCRARGVRTVVVSHEIPETYARHLSRIPPLRSLYLRYERDIAMRASAFVVHTKLHEQAMRELGVAKVHRIPLAILHDPAKVLERRPESIGIYGQIAHKKGHDLLLDAYQRLAPGALPPLRVMGAAMPGHEVWLENLKAAVRPEFAEHIRFTGYLSDEERPDAFARTAFLVFPYRWISQSAALSDACAHGVPYLASDLEYFRDFQASWGCGQLFREGDTGSLAEALQRMSVQHAQIPPSDFETVRSQLSLAHCTRKLRALLAP
jgi:glycosyltransferase involved in cell wall biosynthesis